MEDVDKWGNGDLLDKSDKENKWLLQLPQQQDLKEWKEEKKKEKKKMYKNSQMNEDLVKKKKTEANRK